MRKEDLSFMLHEIKENKRVIVHIEGECYYPIMEVLEQDGCIVLVCKDIKKVEE